MGRSAYSASGHVIETPGAMLPLQDGGRFFLLSGPFIQKSYQQWSKVEQSGDFLYIFTLEKKHNWLQRILSVNLNAGWMKKAASFFLLH
jgi:hypothetical protein